MNDNVILIVFYAIFVLAASSFFWGESLDHAWQFHRKMYYGRILGERRYRLVTKFIAVTGIVGATVGVALVLIKRNG